MKFQKMLLTRIQNSVQNVYIATNDPCDILKIHYETITCDLYM